MLNDRLWIYLAAGRMKKGTISIIFKYHKPMAKFQIKEGLSSCGVGSFFLGGGSFKRSTCILISPFHFYFECQGLFLTSLCAFFSICFPFVLYHPVFFYSVLASNYLLYVQNISSLRQGFCLLGSLLFSQSLEMSLSIVGTQLILAVGILDMQHKIMTVLII